LRGKSKSKKEYQLENKAVFGEFLGTMILVAAIVGSGFMASALSTDGLVQLLTIAISTIFVLGTLILTLGPVSGAHLNPAVTIALAITKQFPANQILVYVIAQVTGGIFGSVLANLMFGSELAPVSQTERFALGTGVGEVVATGLLVFVVLSLLRAKKSNLIAFGVPAAVGSAFFFTSSAAFANPAVTIGRIFTDSITSISPASAAGYVAVQVVGALVAVGVVRVLYAKKGK
jgi:glycerol uptake facilitator-like aquaporin